MDKIVLLIDEDRDGSNVFENFATEFEQLRLEGDRFPEEIEQIQKKIEKIEQILQDLSEQITAENENQENIYSVIIKCSKELLSIWDPLFSTRYVFKQVTVLLDKELENLIKLLISPSLLELSIEGIKEIFKEVFLFTTSQMHRTVESISNLKTKTPRAERMIYKEVLVSLYVSITSSPRFLSLDGKFGDKTAEEIIDLMMFEVADFLTVENLHYRESPSYLEILQKNADKIKTNYIYREDDEKFEEVEDGEDVLYTTALKIWIDTDDASEANQFMALVASVLSSIENVEVKITDSGNGSFWQKWRIKFSGWFAKEETKQTLNKTRKTIEAYTLDKHIEPIEKSKIERKKYEEEIKRIGSAPYNSDKELQSYKNKLRVPIFANARVDRR